MDRIKSGIEGFDKLVEGGIPEESAIILMGPPGAGKTTFSQQLMYNALKNNKNSVYITLDISPEEAIMNMESFGWKLNSMKDNLKIIDGYSWRIGGKKEENVIQNIGDINEINIKMSSVLQGIKANSVGAFDSISTLLIYCDPNMVVKLLPVIIAKAKEAKMIQIFILEEGVHDPKTVNTLAYLTNGLIEFKVEENKRFLRISRMPRTNHEREWVEFKITNNGIVIMEEKKK